MSANSTTALSGVPVPMSKLKSEPGAPMVIQQAQSVLGQLPSPFPTVGQTGFVNQLSTAPRSGGGGSGGGVKRKGAQETEKEKQERIRERNREHARRCRIRKRQAVENLNNKVTKLEHENNVLKTAFRALHNQKSLMEAIVISEFGKRGWVIVDRTRNLKVVNKSSITELCSDILTPGADGLISGAEDTDVASTTDSDSSKTTASDNGSD